MTSKEIYLKFGIIQKNVKKNFLIVMMFVEENVNLQKVMYLNIQKVKIQSDLHSII